MAFFDEERALIISLQKVDAILKAAKYMNKNKQENNNNTSPRIYRPSRLAPGGKELNNFKPTKSNERAAWRPPGVVSTGIVCNSCRERSKVTHSSSDPKDE
ncbi:hypothetical protein ACTXT7_016042 [Hymenolepis weldensis]